MRDKVALFDMDGTLADYHGQLDVDLRKIGCECLPDYSTRGSIPEWLDKRMALIKSQPGWWERLPVIESGIGLLKLCHDIGFDIHIATQGPARAKNAWGEKYSWCEEHVKPIDPNYGISVTRNGKGLYYGRILVDDWPEYMESWLKNRPRGLGLMPSCSANSGFSHPQVLKYDMENWKTQELEDKIRAAYYRK